MEPHDRYSIAAGAWQKDIRDEPALYVGMQADEFLNGEAH
jgi:hypothetical protein